MKYMLLKNFLNRVAYNYYAKNLHESDPEYSKTKEFVNFLSLHSEWEQMLDNFNIILQDINNLFGKENVIPNGPPNLTPGFQIEICLNKTQYENEVITIYISMFIPFYHIVLLSNNRNNVITSSFVIDKKIEKKISHIINQFGYNKFPEELLSCKIPDLIILDKFNYGSAFFTDNYRMSEHKPLR